MVYMFRSTQPPQPQLLFFKHTVKIFWYQSWVMLIRRFMCEVVSAKSTNKWFFKRHQRKTLFRLLEIKKCAYHRAPCSKTTNIVFPNYNVQWLPLCIVVHLYQVLIGLITSWLSGLFDFQNFMKCFVLKCIVYPVLHLSLMFKTFISIFDVLEGELAWNHTVC